MGDLESLESLLNSPLDKSDSFQREIDSPPDKKEKVRSYFLLVYTHS